MNQLETIKSKGNLLREPPKVKKGAKRLRSASPKRAKQLKFYSVLRKGFLAKNRICQAGAITLWHGCDIKACEVHHKNGRRGDMLNDTRHFLAVCRPCHDRIHAHPSEARTLGLLT